MEFINQHTSDLFISDGINLRFPFKLVYLSNGIFFKLCTKIRFDLIIPMSNLLNIGNGFWFNADNVFPYYSLNIFFASSQSTSLSGFLRTLSNRSITICC